MDVIVLILFAIVLHLLIRDSPLTYKGNAGETVSVHALLITSLFAVLLGRAALQLWRAGTSGIFRTAVVLMWATTVMSFLVCLRAVLYPYEADTMEGNILLQGVSVWINPAQLYPDPERDKAVSYIFPPLAGVFFGTIYDLTRRVLFYPRILNFGLICVTGILLTGFINLNRLQGYVVFSSWLCLQVFFSGYLCSIRVDALLVFLAASGCCLFRLYLDRGQAGYLLACGVVLCAAILCKQHGLFVLAGLSLTLLWKREIRAALLLAAVALAPVGLLSVWLNLVTNGWYLRTLSLNAHRFSVGYSITALSAITSYAISSVILGCGIMAFWELIRQRPKAGYPGIWLYVLGACYFPIACAGVLQGGIGSMDNFAFELALLLPIVCARFMSGGRALLACSLLFALSLPYFVKYRPFATWLVYAPEQAQQVVRQIESTHGPVLISRRQEFLLRTGRPVLDDLGDMYFEFVPAGYRKVGTRINREIRSGKYQLIMLEAGELDWLDPETRTWLATHYNLSSDPERALFQRQAHKACESRESVILAAVGRSQRNV
ncbi:MAG: hypothetical protein QOJ99_6023 [Bryobacterales bacterium]|nr:hypothetical protein [Bryobacterales bacterium]